VIDHSHLTGLIRGLLCQACNAALSERWDDEIWKEKALAYLKQDAGIFLFTKDKRSDLPYTNCRYCGKVFLPNRSWALYCSKSCRYTHRNANTRISSGIKALFLLIAPTALFWASCAPVVLA
jgi:hypothetical protein